MTTPTWLGIGSSIGSIIGGLLAVAIRWRAGRAAVRDARSAAQASGAVLYQQLLAEYRTHEMREALQAIKQGKAELPEYRLVSHFFRGATDLLATGAIKGELAEDIKALEGRHLMKHNVIPWEREHRTEIDASAVEADELNERFLRVFDPARGG